METPAKPPAAFLDPGTVVLTRSTHGAPSLNVSGVYYDHVNVYRAFPLTEANRYIAFFNSDDTYIGMIVDLNEVSVETKQIILEEMDRRYFTPEIIRLDRAENIAGRTIMEGETDRGKFSITFRGIRESLVEIETNRFLLTDENGNRYEIRDIMRLDRRSRSYIQRMI